MSVYIAKSFRIFPEGVTFFSICFLFGFLRKDSSLEKSLFYALLFTLVGYSILLAQNLPSEVDISDEGISVTFKKFYRKKSVIFFAYGAVSITYKKMMISRGSRGMILELRDFDDKSLISPPYSGFGIIITRESNSNILLKPTMFGWSEDLISQIVTELQRRNIPIITGDSIE